MTKTNILIIVQGPHEDAAQFSKRLTEELADKQLILPNPIQFTTASDGRQTCNICYYTEEKKSNDQ